MTIIYEPGVTERGEWCNTCTTEDFNRFRVELDGTPRRATWKPVCVKMIRRTLRHKFQQVDAPWYGSDLLIFRRSVLEKMGAILEANGELLPLKCADAELWVYNPTNVLAALDKEATVGDRFDDGCFAQITKYVFFPDVVAGVDVFKLKNERASSTYLSDRFVEMWKAAGLTGLRFDKVWSSEE
jgi:hypothetical protein